MTAKPLTDTDYDRLAGILNRFRSERALNLEQLDGFFAALISGPGHIQPSEFLPELWGDEIAEDPLREPAGVKGIPGVGAGALERDRRDAAVG